MKSGQKRKVRRKTKKMATPDKLEDMLQYGWKVIDIYGYTLLVLARGESRRLVDKDSKIAVMEYEYKGDTQS